MGHPSAVRATREVLVRQAGLLETVALALVVLAALVPAFAGG